MAANDMFALFDAEEVPKEPSDSPVGLAEQGEQKASRPAKLNAKFPLPPLRIPVPKQLEILRGHVVASKRGEVPVTNAGLANVVGMHANNVSIANPFFASVGLIRKEGHNYLPSDTAVEYHQAAEWEPDTASLKLAPVFAESWFGKIVEQQLTLRPRSVKEIVAAFASASSAPKDAVGSLMMLLEYLKLAGLVAVEGDTVQRTAAAGGPPKAEDTARPSQATPNQQPPTTPPAKTPPPPPPAPPTGDGQGVRFTINFDVSMAEISTWTPDRIAAFFAGVAQVVAAKNGGKT